MFFASIVRCGQVRSAASQLFHASQLSHGLFVRCAVAAVNSTICASQICIRRKGSTMPDSSESLKRKVPTPWTILRTEKVKKTYFHKYSSAVVNLSSCFSTLAIQHTRSACISPCAAAPEATWESSERILAMFHRTIDKKETHFFNKHSADWWDVNGPFAALHDYTPHRVEFLISNLQTLPHYQEILRQRVHSEAVDTSCSVPNPPQGGWSAKCMSLLAQRGHGAPTEQQSIRQSAASAGFVCRRAPFAVGGDPVPQQPRGRLDGCTVLDVGCGGGILSEALAREGSAVVGVDAAREAINVAEHRRLRGPYAPLIRDRQRYVNGSLEEYVAHRDQLLNSSQRGSGNHQIADNLDPLSRNSLFDIVVFSEVLEHIRGGLDSVERLLAMAAEKCLKPGGLLMVTTLNRTPANYLISIVAAECVLNVVPQGTHSWEKFIKPEEISLIGERHGLRLIQQRGFAYVPFIRIFVDEPFCRLLYMMAFEKL